MFTEEEYQEKLPLYLDLAQKAINKEVRQDAMKRGDDAVLALREDELAAYHPASELDALYCWYGKVSDELKFVNSELDATEKALDDPLRDYLAKTELKHEIVESKRQKFSLLEELKFIVRKIDAIFKEEYPKRIAYYLDLAQKAINEEVRQDAMKRGDDAVLAYSEDELKLYHPATELDALDYWRMEVSNRSKSIPYLSKELEFINRKIKEVSEEQYGHGER